MAVISLEERRAGRLRGQSPEDRAHDAIERWARTVVQCERSRSLISSSRATLARSRPRFSGGGGLFPEDAAVRSRLRSLIDAGLLPSAVPRGWIGPCLKQHQCIACEDDIHLQETEFELESAKGAVFFHRRCLDLWRREDGRPHA
jgi:hypothetical protein